MAGWSHFAQFTIAVVNKDPKKSKYSGRFSFTLHCWDVLFSHAQGKDSQVFYLACRHSPSILQEGARLGLEKVHGAFESSGGVHRCKHAGDQSAGASDQVRLCPSNSQFLLISFSCWRGFL